MVYIRPFPMRFDFRASDFDPIAFSDVKLANRNSPTQMGKTNTHEKELCTPAKLKTELFV